MNYTRSLFGFSRRRGTSAVLVAIAIVAMFGMTALAVDVGLVVAGVQRAQEVCDAAALAGAADRIAGQEAAAQTRISGNVAANNEAGGFKATVGDSDVTFYGSGAAVPGFRTLSGSEEAVKVVAHVQVPFSFAAALGLNGVSTRREAVALRRYSPEARSVPMWISAWQIFNDPRTGEPPEHLFEVFNLLYTNSSTGGASPSDPTYIPPGNFGFTTPLTGNPDFPGLLSGVGLPPSVYEANRTHIGETVTGNTGVSTGQWQQALGASTTDGRLARAALPPYSGGTYQSHLPDDPRILIVPLVAYLGGTGSGASYEILGFGAFWLEEVHGPKKTLTGRFIDYSMPGHEGGPDFASFYAIELVL